MKVTTLMGILCFGIVLCSIVLYDAATGEVSDWWDGVHITPVKITICTECGK